jgi:putative hemolysin
MDGHLIWELAAILALVLANGFFALSEFSVIASRRSRLQQKVEEGKTGARTAVQLHENPDNFLATIQVGITLVGTLAGVFGGATLVKPLGGLIERIPVEAISEASAALAVAGVTVMITGTAVVVGELMPKYLALSNPERWARWVARPMTLFTTLAALPAKFLSSTANLLVRMMGVKPDESRHSVSEDEINLMIFEGKQKGVFDETEERLVKSVFDFADSTARRAMTPRTDVVGVELRTAPEDVIELAIDEGFTRYPVFDKTIDNVVGVLYAKDLVLNKLDPKLIVLKDLIRKIHFVPDSMPLSQVLWDFQRRRQRMAIVLDEYGGTAGIITLHDILEELVGEIQEEDEQGSAELVKHSDDVAFADGSVWPGAINELMSSHLPQEKVDTLAGLIGDRLGRVPDKSETVDISDMRITVLEKTGHRLVRLKLEKIDPADGDSNGS